MRHSPDYWNNRHPRRRCHSVAVNSTVSELIQQNVLGSVSEKINLHNNITMMTLKRSPRESITVPTCAACATFSRAPSECTPFHLSDIVADLVPNFRSNRGERKHMQLSRNWELKWWWRIKCSKEEWREYTAVNPSTHRRYNPYI